MRKAVTIIPTQLSGTDRPTAEIREMVALKERGWMDPGLLKSHTLAFDDAQQAYDMYTDQSDGVIKVSVSIPG